MLSNGISDPRFLASTGNAASPFTLQSLAFPSTCNERLSQLVGDIFIGNEMIPQVLDLPPDYPLELTYRYGFFKILKNFRQKLHECNFF